MSWVLTRLQSRSKSRARVFGGTMHELIIASKFALFARVTHTASKIAILAAE